jgi:hypothetical protein
MVAQFFKNQFGERLSPNPCYKYNTNTNIYFSLRAWHTIDSQAAVTGNG